MFANRPSGNKTETPSTQNFKNDDNSPEFKRHPTFKGCICAFSALRSYEKINKMLPLITGKVQRIPFPVLLKLKNKQPTESISIFVVVLAILNKDFPFWDECLVCSKALIYSRQLWSDSRYIIERESPRNTTTVNTALPLSCSVLCLL